LIRHYGTSVEEKNACSNAGLISPDDMLAMDVPPTGMPRREISGSRLALPQADAIVMK